MESGRPVTACSCIVTQYTLNQIVPDIQNEYLTEGLGGGGVGVWGSDLLGECSGYMVRIIGQLWPYSAFCLIYSPQSQPYLLNRSFAELLVLCFLFICFLFSLSRLYFYVSIIATVFPLLRQLNHQETMSSIVESV